MTVPTDLSRAETLRTLREQVNTHVALPGEPGYERCMPWNVAAAITPAAVVLATTPEDVAGTVRFAAEHDFTVGNVGERDGARRDRNLRAVGRGGAHVVRAQRDGHVRQTCQITKVSAAHAVR